MCTTKSPWSTSIYGVPTPIINPSDVKNIINLSTGFVFTNTDSDDVTWGWTLTGIVSVIVWLRNLSIVVGTRMAFCIFNILPFCRRQFHMYIREKKKRLHYDTHQRASQVFNASKGYFRVCVRFAAVMKVDIRKECECYYVFLDICVYSYLMRILHIVNLNQQLALSSYIDITLEVGLIYPEARDVHKYVVILSKSGCSSTITIYYIVAL